jgi:hypothetical protein
MTARTWISFCTVALMALPLGAQTVHTVLSPLSSQQQRALIVQAKRAYYNLHTAGVSGVITADAAMEWDNRWASQAKELPHVAQAEQLAVALKKVEFNVIFHTDNSIEVTPLNLPKLADAKESAWQEAVVDRMGGALRVILQGWARYEIRSGFERPDIESSVVDLGPRYAVTYKAPGVEEVITMGRDFQIEEAHLKTFLDVSASSHPKFRSTPDGFLLTHWESSVTGRVALSVSAAVTYADVQGIPLPQTVVATYKPCSPGAHVSIMLSNYRFRRL